MLSWFLRRELDAEEKKLGESMDYLRHIVDVSPAAFLRFASIMPFANSRKTLPKEAWYVAQIVTLQHEDCGPCLQITINLARQQGVAAELIRSALDGDCETIQQDLAEVYTFTKSVTVGSEDAGLRDKLRDRYCDRGLIELAYAIASARIPPTVKRVLGYATSCKSLEVRT